MKRRELFRRVAGAAAAAALPGSVERFLLGSYGTPPSTGYWYTPVDWGTFSGSGTVQIVVLSFPPHDDLDW